MIGKSGAEVDALRRELHKMTSKQVRVNILEVKRPELDAKLVAQSIAEQLQNRVAFRRAMKRAITSAMRSGAKGMSVQVSGRLGGCGDGTHRGLLGGPGAAAHPARGHRLRAFTRPSTTFGRIGVKCWINNGEVMPVGYGDRDGAPDAPAPQRGRGSGPGRRPERRA